MVRHLLTPPRRLVVSLRAEAAEGKGSCFSTCLQNKKRQLAHPSLGRGISRNAVSQAWAAHTGGAQMFSEQQSPLKGEGILAFRYCGTALSGDPGPCGLAIEGNSWGAV